MLFLTPHEQVIIDAIGQVVIEATEQVVCKATL